METTKIGSNLPLTPSVFTSREEGLSVDTEDGAIFLLATKWEKSSKRLFSCKGAEITRGEKPLTGEAWRRLREREGAGSVNQQPGGETSRRRGFSVAKGQSSRGDRYREPAMTLCRRSLAKGGFARREGLRGREGRGSANQQPATRFLSQAKVGVLGQKSRREIGGCSLCGVGAQRGGSNQISKCQRG
ncbi:hypothetical protein Adt_14686 [Abeliophyllum distichum]|uniref:Uncharacterized protein n=1 Tax=Abeliophyllum distichum TaxID=126358 RepID=A0ABD1U0B6_9LAMI